MDFGSPQFLFRFLPVVVAAYCLAPIRWRAGVLLLSSLYFYGQGDPLQLPVFCLIVAVNYLFMHLIAGSEVPARRSKAVTVAVAGNLAILFLFKYLGFFLGTVGALLEPLGAEHVSAPELALPLGISFLCFQAIAYALDLYRQAAEPERNPLRFALFFALFPKVTAGPIIRYREVAAELERASVSAEGFLCGFKRMVIGLGKKLIIADTLAGTADQLFVLPAGELSAAGAWLGIVCYSLQLYFDFSGYTDLALGLARIFGFRLGENFDYPYSAKSLTEFWRRWHISLSTWFRDYLYLPLSYALMTENVRQKMAMGKYRTNYRGLLAIFAVFTLCGLWHGANWNFVIWGMLHGVVLALESWKLGKVLKKAPPTLAHLYLIVTVMFCWVFFRIPNFAEALEYLQTLAGFGAVSGLGQLRQHLTIELLLVLTIAAGGCFPWARAAREMLEKRLARELHPAAAVAEATWLAAVFVVSLQAVSGAVSKPFIYGQF